MKMKLKVYVKFLLNISMQQKMNLFDKREHKDKNKLF